MAALIALVGGDEFRHGCEAMDQELLSAVDASRPTVLVVPTAAAAESPARAASNGVGYFSSLGAEASALMVLGPDHANDGELLAPVDGADVIYFTGGNPTHLLETIGESLLLKMLVRAVERGALLAGSSAGAMVMGSWMRFRGWRRALDIAGPVAILPHHERSEPNAVANELGGSAPHDVDVLGIDGMTACLARDDGWRVVGAGSVVVYRAGRWARYSSGETIDLST